MNKKKLLNILQCLFMATVTCIAVIFVIKYIFEIRLIETASENKTDNITVESKEETVIETDTTVIEAIEDTTDLDDIPLDERTYEVNEKIYKNKDLLSPCEYYNNAIIYNNAAFMNKAYPEIMSDFLVKQTDFLSLDEYVDNLYTKYYSLFGNDFIINNTLLDTTILTEDELADMNSFFNHILGPEIDIEYAVLMKTICSIRYFDSDSLTEVDTDSETEYFLSYYYNGNWYIDYLYTDYYFFN